ncbi:MAG: VWA domain-containing protein [Alphaproteobacteria bacterium]|nr:VWA domain-containing protein [Alphaproteobacteria bacterium]
MTFLRPWLLCLIIVPFLFNKLAKRLHSNNPWVRIIDPKLLPHLLVSKGRFLKQKYWSGALKILWISFIIAIAGPCFNHVQIPAIQDLKNTVLVLDLGPAMTPNMLSRAKTTLYDLVDVLPNDRIALVVYADKGYTAVPLTADKAVIKNLIPALNASILPNTHNNPETGFNRAEQLIDQAGKKGRIIYLTAGGVNVQDVKTKYPVGVLNLGKSEDASPALKNLGYFQQSAFFNKQQLAGVLQATDPGSSTPNFSETDQTELWLDIGGILCLILLPFFALTFRKGKLFLIVIGFYSVTAQANFFVRQDQKLYRQEQQAVQAYHAGQYDQALVGFSHNPYNQGNTLAHMGKIPEAIESYKLALQLDPNDEDALFNKKYLEEQLKKQQKQDQKEQDSERQSEESQQDSAQSDQQENNDPDSSKNQNEEQSGEDNENQSAEAQENSSESDPDTQPQLQDKTDKQSKTAQAQEEQSSEINQPTPLDTAQEQAPFNQQEQQILNRLNKDPSQVLRYRIYRQHMQGK